VSKGFVMADVLCKHCGSDAFVKNGKQKGYQNYLCKSCKRNFVPPRRNQDRAIEKKLAVILYSSGKGSFSYLARLFGVCPATVLNWVRAYADKISDPVVASNLTEIELDEMWHYLHEKKQNCGSLKPLIEQAEERLHGLQETAISPQSCDYTRS
jgi:transposase